MSNTIIYFQRRRGGIMCAILQKLKDRTPDELLREYGISPMPPIDVSLLLRNIGISEIPFDFSEIEAICKYEKGDILGITYAKNDTLNIFYRSSDTLNRKRFTIAHELAHCCLDADSLKNKHIELRSSRTSGEPKELKANQFAGELLIPESSFDSIYDRFIIPPPLSALTKIYKVSTNVMAARMDYLNIPYIKDKPIDEN